MNKIKSFETPEFILGYTSEKEILNYDRIFITHKGLSLIEAVNTTRQIFRPSDERPFKYYELNKEEFCLCYHTCNVEYFGLNPVDVLNSAWEWLSKVLTKEQEAINREDFNSLN